MASSDIKSQFQWILNTVANTAAESVCHRKMVVDKWTKLLSSTTVFVNAGKEFNVLWFWTMLHMIRQTCWLVVNGNYSVWVPHWMCPIRWQHAGRVVLSDHKWFVMLHFIDFSIVMCLPCLQYVGSFNGSGEYWRRLFWQYDVKQKADTHWKKIVQKDDMNVMVSEELYIDMQLFQQVIHRILQLCWYAQNNDRWTISSVIFVIANRNNKVW